MGYMGFVQRSMPTFYCSHIYIYNTSTHSVYIDFNMAKIRISHLSDPLCMQFHLSYTPRISYIHTNVLCSLFQCTDGKILYSLHSCKIWKKYY